MAKKHNFVILTVVLLQSGLVAMWPRCKTWRIPDLEDYGLDKVIAVDNGLAIAYVRCVLLLLRRASFALQTQIFGVTLVMKPVKMTYFSRLQRFLFASLKSTANS